MWDTSGLWQVWHPAVSSALQMQMQMQKKKKKGSGLVAIRRTHAKAHLRNAAEVVHSESCVQAGRA